MTGTRYRRTTVLGFALLAGSALTAPAVAQTGQPPHRAIDANGVDLISGTYPLQLTEGTIGTGLGAITLERQGTGGGIGNWQNMYVQRAVSGSTTTAVVVLGDHSETFTYNGTSYTPNQANGARLTGGEHADFAYVGSDGTVIVFGAAGTEDRNGASNLCSHSNSDLTSCFAVPTSLTKPNGLTFTFEWDVHANCSTTFNPDGSRDCTFAWRLDTVANSFGNSVAFEYDSDFVSLYANPGPNWYKRKQATLSNGTTTRTVDNNFVSSTETQVTDANGRMWTITDGTTTLALRRPGSGSDDVTVTFSGGAVSQVVRDGIATAYSRSVASNIATTTITDAESHVSTVVANTSTGRITSVTELGHQTQYQYDSSGRLEKVTEPDGNYTFYTHDSRGNVTEVRRVAKPGTNLPDIVTSADYEQSCAHVWCNQPRTTTDERGNVTEYTYDDTHGGVTIVTAPAPSGSGTRPQTRYSYTLTNGEYRLTGISACATGSAPSCLGTADETRTVIAYGTDGNVASVQRRDGTGALSATTAYTYNQLGDLETVDGPLSGAADTTRYRYDTARQLVGIIGPDPDGAGARKHQAQRITYDTGGRATSVELGTVNSQSDTDWTGMDVASRTEQDYDATNHRPTVRRLRSGTTIHALTQTNYDSLGRVWCVAQRMNTSEFASLPTSACALDTTGLQGPDRITQTTYDALGCPLLVKTGLDVTGQTADEVATTYTDNGRVSYVTDAEGNRTTYEYDGHDRLLNTRYPSPTTDGVSAPTSGTGNDYEQLTYATATVALSPVSTSLVSSRRLRNGNSIAYAYDALGQLTSKDPSASSELTVSYTYDLMGRMTGASQTGQALTFAWDALGRMTSASTQLGGTTRTLTYEYDLAGNRTRITHPDSAYFTYARDVLGRPTLIREGGVNWLNGFSYTDMGAVSDQSYNAASLTTYGASSYGYNDLGQLTASTHNLAGTGDDLQSSFLYNPAGQISSQTRSDNDYAWQRHYGATRSYITNGLNQYSTTASTTSAGSASSTLTHDMNGNLSGASWTSSAGSGSRTYTYDSENRLVSASGGTSATLAYDPLGRLSEITAGSTTTRFLYDGDALVAEYDGANAMTHRYVHGDGADTPEVSYTGSSLSSPNFLVADERGSIVAVTDAAGNAVAINSYDEYGIPGASNSGRFQYTGQTWLPELGVYYYKARLYSPYLGRFFQTDPIGYGDGMNIYAYVGNDPANFLDPLGLRKVCIEQPGSRIPFCREEKDENEDGVIDSRDRHATESDIRFMFANPDIFASNSQEMTALNQIMSQLTLSLSSKDLEKALNFFERNTARLAYATNLNGMKDNISAMIRAFGGNFTQVEIDSVMRDILNGNNTTMANLRALGNISSTNISRDQFGIINGFIHDLPNTPLNQRVRAGWTSRWRRGG